VEKDRKKAGKKAGKGLPESALAVIPNKGGIIL